MERINYVFQQEKHFFCGFKNHYLPTDTMSKLHRFFQYSFSLAFVILMACNPVYRAGTVEYKGYPVQSEQKDAALQAMLQPYADSVNSSMNAVIAQLAVDIDKRQPESTIGNLMADAMKAMGEKYYQTTIDAAFVNYGGIRIPSVKAGALTRGKVFEMMPFDNIIVLQKLKGTVLKEFLDHIAGRGGWPVAGLTMQIKNRKAENILIAGKPLDLNAVYTIANSDYVTNGGDDCAMLRPIPAINNGSLFRNALLDYFSSFAKDGKQISMTIQNRVTNAQ
jgi:2',3'-cyclic-nucleotide 2'-phosphodiesterase (5'-nucleotidase family)